MLSRRRFMTIAAACAIAPHGARAAQWQGHALGAQAEVTLRGFEPQVLDYIPVLLDRVGRLFSLYHEGSALRRLNRHGRLPNPDPDFVALMRAADRAYGASGGLFDPTIQGVWADLAVGRRINRDVLGWNRIEFSDAAVRLGPKQALSFNGIAQGFATDLVTGFLRSQGAVETLVNIGEYRALGGPWRIGIEDVEDGRQGWRTLSNGALATSSPGALRFGGQAHILNPLGTGAPLWSSVTVEADSATMADAASTASRSAVQVACSHADDNKQPQFPTCCSLQGH